MFKRFAVLMVAIIALQSCKVKISPSDESWNPYEVGDTFSFENRVGEQKTFEISKIESSTVKENVYAGNLSRKKENLVVFAKQTGPSASEEFALLSMQANIGGDSEIGLLLAIPGQLEANYIIPISEINANDQLIIKGVVYEEVFEVATTLQIGEGVNTPYPLKLYYSKSAGFLGYDMNNGDKWRLN